MNNSYKELDCTLVKLIQCTPGISDHFYSNIKQVLYLQVDPYRIYNMSVTIRLVPIMKVAAWQGINNIILMDMIPIHIIRDAEQQFIKLN